MDKATKDCAYYEVFGVDTFDDPFTDFFIGSFSSVEEAKTTAVQESGQMLKTYVYDAAGKRVFSAGCY